MDYTETYKKKMVEKIEKNGQSVEYLSKRYNVDSTLIEKWLDDALKQRKAKNEDQIKLSKDKIIRGLKIRQSKSGYTYEVRLTITVNDKVTKYYIGRYKDEMIADKIFNEAVQLRKKYKNEELVIKLDALKKKYQQYSNSRKHNQDGQNVPVKPGSKPKPVKFKYIRVNTTKSGYKTYYVDTMQSNTHIYLGKFDELWKARVVADKIAEYKKSHTGVFLLDALAKLKEDIANNTFDYGNSSDNAIVTEENTPVVSDNTSKHDDMLSSDVSVQSTVATTDVKQESDSTNDIKENATETKMSTNNVPAATSETWFWDDSFMADADEIHVVYSHPEQTNSRRIRALRNVISAKPENSTNNNAGYYFMDDLETPQEDINDANNVSSEPVVMDDAVLMTEDTAQGSDTEPVMNKDAVSVKENIEEVDNSLSLLLHEETSQVTGEPESRKEGQNEFTSDTVEKDVKSGQNAPYVPEQVESASFEVGVGAFLKTVKTTFTSMLSKLATPAVPVTIQTVAPADVNTQSEDRWISVSERYPNAEECKKNDGIFIVSDGTHEYTARYGFANVIKWKVIDINNNKNENSKEDSNG